MTLEFWAGFAVGVVSFIPLLVLVSWLFPDHFRFVYESEEDDEPR